MSQKGEKQPRLVPNLLWDDSTGSLLEEEKWMSPIKKMVTNDSESEVRSQDGPKWVKSSPWLSETDQQWWVMEKMLLNPSVSIRY